jgi:hypothetical protein
LSITITNATTVTALFLDANQDADSDGVADWFELHYHGTLAQDPISDTDGDGFTLPMEFVRDSHPNLPDSINSGGISRRSSGILLALLDTNLVSYAIQSVPPGLFDSSDFVPNGSTQYLPAFVDGTGGYYLGEWLLNGQRIADELGRAVGGLPIVITNNSELVGKFFTETEDSDNDGVPDWFEWQYYGSLVNDAASDTDGDGFNLLVEFQRDFHPQLADVMSGGGISRRSSALFAADLSGFAYYIINSDPPGFADESAAVTVGTLITTPYFSGITNGMIFSHWNLNGVRQLDVFGHPLNQLSITVLSYTLATAVFYGADADSDLDGLPDWWEALYFGHPTNTNAGADNDGDGMANGAEFLAQTNPADPSSALRITLATLEPTGFSFAFPTVSGLVYQVQYKYDLTSTNAWETADEEIDGTGSLVQVIDEDSLTETQKFYRVRLKPAP